MKTFVFLIALLSITILLNQDLYSQSKCEKCKCETCTETCCRDGKCSGEADCCKEKKCCGPEETTATQTSEKCIVGGEVLSEGQTVEFVYLGQAYKFCCEGCLAKFKKEPADYIKTKMTCMVMPEDEIDKETFVIYDDVKYYFCCPGCVKKFEKDPEKYLKK